ncbi:MAG: hypothetical protein LBS00_02540, partial [Synergistaceae bacterium]|nr:hypothetical protein [Synergistaceae bacterium]
TVRETENAAPAGEYPLTLFPGLIESKYVLDDVEGGFNTPYNFTGKITLGLRRRAGSGHKVRSGTVFLSTTP